MKWVVISGGWRKTNQKIEKQIRQIVQKIIKRGDGIISGGALGVDLIALDEALKNNPQVDRIKIFLPASLDIFFSHLRRRASEGVITFQQAEDIINQIKKLVQISPPALVENKEAKVLNKETYYQRNSAEIEAADELIAFHIITEQSNGLGTLDTIEKAKQKGMPVKIFSFDLRK